MIRVDEYTRTVLLNSIARPAHDGLERAFRLVREDAPEMDASSPRLAFTIDRLRPDDIAIRHGSAIVLLVDPRTAEELPECELRAIETPEGPALTIDWSPSAAGGHRH